MSIKAGVWIDHHKAVVVLMNDSGEEIKQIESNADKLTDGQIAARVRKHFGEKI